MKHLKRISIGLALVVVLYSCTQEVVPEKSTLTQDLKVYFELQGFEVNALNPNNLSNWPVLDTNKDDFEVALSNSVIDDQFLAGLQKIYDKHGVNNVKFSELKLDVNSTSRISEMCYVQWRHREARVGGRLCYKGDVCSTCDSADGSWECQINYLSCAL